ncbi:MAG: hypothetical protein ACLTMP_03905 [Eggerthella lenta]
MREIDDVLAMDDRRASPRLAGGAVAGSRRKASRSPRSRTVEDAVTVVRGNACCWKASSGEQRAARPTSPRGAPDGTYVSALIDGRWRGRIVRAQEAPLRLPLERMSAGR